MPVTIPNDKSITSVEAFNLKDSTVIIEMIDGITSDLSSQTQLSIGIGKHLGVFVYTTLSRYTTISGLEPTIAASFFDYEVEKYIGRKKYDAVQDRWWRIWESGNFITIDTSPDKKDWTTVASKEHRFLPNELKLMKISVSCIGERTLGPVVVDNLNVPFSHPETALPRKRTAEFMGMIPDAIWNGRNNEVGVADQGTTRFVRERIGINLRTRRYWFTPPANRETYLDQEHGCLVTPNTMIKGAKGMSLVEAVITENSGDSSFDTIMQSLRWLADQGVKMMNLSFGSDGNDATAAPAFRSMFNYLKDRGVVIAIAAGNSNLNAIATPARYSAEFPDNVISVIAWEERYNVRAYFSNYASYATCCAPGRDIGSLTPAATEKTWNGTSGASPNALTCVVVVNSANAFGAVAAYKALKKNRRYTGQIQSLQGGGSFDVYETLKDLGVVQRRASMVCT